MAPTPFPFVSCVSTPNLRRFGEELATKSWSVNPGLFSTHSEFGGRLFRSEVFLVLLGLCKQWRGSEIEAAKSLAELKPSGSTLWLT